MRIYSQKVALLISALFLLGSYDNCGQESMPEKQENEVVCDGFLGVHREICEVLKAPPCKTLDACDTVNVSFTSKVATVRSLGQRILVIDIYMALPAYTRYKSRVLEHLIHDDQGLYRLSTEAIRIPRTIFTVLSQILDEKYPDLPAKKLSEIEGIYGRHTKLLMREHGSYKFATLADFNPNAEFVIADLFKLPNEDFCRFAEDDGAKDRVRNFLRNAANSLVAVIDKYDINFVNMSFGTTEADLQGSWPWKCPKKAAPSADVLRQMIQFYKQYFYEPLFSAKKVVFVQSAPYSIRHLVKDDVEFPIDCQDVDNRLTVSAFASIDSKLPILGLDQKELLGDYFKGPWDCVDLYVNLGVSPKRPYGPGKYPSLFTLEGVGTSPNGRPSTSDAAPQALSHFIYLKNSGLVLGEGAVFVSNLKSYLQGKLIDPYRFQQFEIYRLGRL